jgi:hypothetical protein
MAEDAPAVPGCRNGSCRLSPTELDDLLGHDGVGHQARNALCRAGYRTREQVAALSDRQLLKIRKFGVMCLARVREAFPASQRVP